MQVGNVDSQCLVAMATCLLLVLFAAAEGTRAADPLDVWPALAPGETTRLIGEKLPYRENEVPPVTRVVKITRPTFTIHLAEKSNGAGMVILPGGGFG